MKFSFFLSLFFFAITVMSQNLSDSLKAHFRFDNNLLDVSQYLEHLTSTSSISYMNSRNNQVLNTNGTESIRSINSFDNSYYQEASISLWINTNNLTNSNDQILIQGANMGFAITVEPSSGKVSGFYRPPSWSAIESTTNVVDGQWHHILLSNNGSTTKLYIDGVQEASKNESIQVGNGSSNNRLYIGNSNLGTRPYTGLIDDIQIYNRALSQSEIDTLSGKNNCIPNLTQNLNAHFEFEGNSQDVSGNNEHLINSLTSPSFTNFNATDSAYYFDGQTRLESQTNFDNSNYSALAISMWVKTSSLSNQTLIQGAFMGFGVYINSSNRKASCFFDFSSANSLVGFTTINDGQWHHIVAQNNGTESFVYVDGAFENNQLEPLIVGNGLSNNKIYLGMTNLSANPLLGSLNDVRIYDRILSSCEIDSLFQSKRPLITSLKEEITNEREITVFPNPVVDKCTVSVSENLLGSSIHVRNLLGKTIQIIENIKEETTTFSMDQRSGVYFVEIHKKGTILETKKLIKL